MPTPLPPPIGGILFPNSLAKSKMHTLLAHSPLTVKGGVQHNILTKEGVIVYVNPRKGRLQ